MKVGESKWIDHSVNWPLGEIKSVKWPSAKNKEFKGQRELDSKNNDFEKRKKARITASFDGMKNYDRFLRLLHHAEKNQN